MAMDLARQKKREQSELRISRSPSRVRAQLDGQTVVDTTAALLVWEPRRITPEFAVPPEALTGTLTNPTRAEKLPDDLADRPVLSPADRFSAHSTPGTAYDVQVDGRTLAAAAFVPDDPDLRGAAILQWTAFDRWLVEDDEALGHPHDPFARIDCHPTSRHVVVSLDGTVLADSTRAVVLLETGLPPRYYLPRSDVRMDLLEPSDTVTTCAYKGHASYYSALVGDRVVPDIVWTYEEPLQDAVPVGGMLCFFVERTDETVDGVVSGRPRTQWSPA